MYIVHLKACLNYESKIEPIQTYLSRTRLTHVCTRLGLMRVPSMSTARIIMVKSGSMSAYWQCMSFFDATALESISNVHLCGRALDNQF